MNPPRPAIEARQPALHDVLALGLGTRMAAATLLCMTLVIQRLVYPMARPAYLAWATLALYLIGHGGGRAALDHWLPHVDRRNLGA